MATITILNFSLSEEFKNIYLSNSKIHYSKNEKDYAFSSEDKKFLIFKVSEMIADFIIKTEETKIIRQLINKDYHYFSNLEKKYILNSTLEILNTHSDDDILKLLFLLKRRALVRSSLISFFETTNTLDFHGFVSFGLKNYKEYMSEFIEKSVDSYIIQKEYSNFISMLQFFVNNQKIKSSKVHLIVNENFTYTLLDSFQNDITDQCFNEFYLEDPNKQLNNEDLLLSSLISLSPKKIYIQINTDKYNRKILETIKHVFENRVIMKENSWFPVVCK